MTTLKFHEFDLQHVLEHHYIGRNIDCDAIVCEACPLHVPDAPRSCSEMTLRDIGYGALTEEQKYLLLKGLIYGELEVDDGE